MFLRAVSLIAFVFVTAPTAKGVDWEEQAERLQLVNAAMLDGAPVARPIGDGLTLGLTADISLLPTVNPKVGAKSEDVPSPPAHLVPTLSITDDLLQIGDWLLTFEFAVGYLPAGGEKLLGIDAAASQLNVRGAFGFETKDGKFGLFAGGHGSGAEVTGAITSENAKDEFTVDTSIVFVSSYVAFDNGRCWLGALVGQRESKSEFYIEEDDTKLALEDSNLLAQLTAGYRWDAFGFALSEVIVPERVLMPRVSLEYLVRL